MSSRQSKVAAIAPAALIVPFILACATDTPTNTRSAPNTGEPAGGSSGRGSGGQATGGTRSGGDTGGSGANAGAGGNRSSGGAGVDASLTAGGAGGATSGTGGTGGVGVHPEVDAGPEPPPYCVAPCVWELVKHCVPDLRECVREPEGSGSITCDPATGWSLRESQTRPRTYDYFTSFRGAVCFHFEDSYIAPNYTAHYDANDNPIAFQVGNVVYCGARPSDVVSATRTDAGLVLGDGRVAPAFPLRPNEPDCAAWGRDGLPVHQPCKAADGGSCQ